MSLVQLDSYGYYDKPEMRSLIFKLNKLTQFSQYTPQIEAVYGNKTEINHHFSHKTQTNNDGSI